MNIEIVHEDDDIIVVNKPHNLVVYKSYFSRNIKEKSLLTHLEELCNEKLHIMHRLDRKTGGIIILGKNKETARYFQKLFQNNEIEKTYLAIVRGHSELNGIVDTPIKAEDDKEYKPAFTEYQTLAKIELLIPVGKYDTARYSLIELHPKTGRTHQLRKHMNKINHPIIGDHKYGDRFHNRMFAEKMERTNLFLFASKISFVHPKTKEKLNLTCKPSDAWNTILEKFNYEI